MILPKLCGSRRTNLSEGYSPELFTERRPTKASERVEDNLLRICEDAVTNVSYVLGLLVESAFQSPRFSSTRSIRRSGMNQISATDTYKPVAIQGFTNASGMAMK